MTTLEVCNSLELSYFNSLYFQNLKITSCSTNMVEKHQLKFTGYDWLSVTDTTNLVNGLTKE